MALSALESIILTFAIVGSVHLMVTLLGNLEDDHMDYRPVMRDIAKYKFMHENRIFVQNPSTPFFH